jgi:hypothetical protein
MFMFHSGVRGEKFRIAGSPLPADEIPSVIEDVLFGAEIIK